MVDLIIFVYILIKEIAGYFYLLCNCWLPIYRAARDVFKSHSSGVA